MANPERVLIVGAGGHGQVVADILLSISRQGGRLEPVGYVDDDVRLLGVARLGLPVLGVVAKAIEIDHAAAIVAIGGNDVRRRIYRNLAAREERFATAIHPSAILGRSVEIGSGTVICAGVVVNPGSFVGSNAILNTGCVVEHHCTIADHTHIAPGVCMGGEVSIGAGSLVGIGAVILPGVRIGEACVVGAGAVVTRDLADGVTAVGAPARTMRRA